MARSDDQKTGNNSQAIFVSLCVLERLLFFLLV
jgi:hypothetical protein